LAKHGKGEEQWSPVVAKLGKMPEFQQGVTWIKARQHFQQLIAAYKPKPSTGADNEPYTELEQLLEDIKAQLHDEDASK
jgi:hypothetical protein